MYKYIKDLNQEEINTYQVEDFNQYNRLLIRVGSKLTLNILQQNIRSIAKNFEELVVFLDHFNKSFDVIILTET